MYRSGQVKRIYTSHVQQVTVLQKTAEPSGSHPVIRENPVGDDPIIKNRTIKIIVR